MTPGESAGTRIIDSPLCRGWSGSVRHASQIQSAYWMSDVHIFWPLITHSPAASSSTALVCSDARSVPEPGSE